jgi:hypothetical protein
VLLRGRNGTELGLTITGYQFPDETVDPWDSNSLLIEVRIVAPQGAWHVVDPCLTTWETAHTVRWLLALSQRADLVANRPIAMSEPNLTLTGRSVPGHADRALVTACFALELRPPWVTGGGDLCVDLDLDRSQLAQAAADLRAQLGRHPQRGDDPTL